MAGLFGSKVQKPTPVTALPDEELMKASKKKSIAKQRTRTGRDSTVLTDGAYSKETMGP